MSLGANSHPLRSAGKAADAIFQMDNVDVDAASFLDLDVLGGECSYPRPRN